MTHCSRTGRSVSSPVIVDRKLINKNKPKGKIITDIGLWQVNLATRKIYDEGTL